MSAPHPRSPRRLTIFLTALIASFLSASMASAQENPILPGSGGNTLLSSGPNLLDVRESIVPLGDGRYEYSYVFTNAEPTDIWHFNIYTSFPLESGSLSSDAFPGGHGDTGSPTSTVYPAYDPANVDPSATMAHNLWYTPYATNGLAPNDSASVTFIANALDVDPKLFFYETLGSGYAAQDPGPTGLTGHVAAYGYTVVPEPGTALLLSAGLLGMGLRRRRRASCRDVRG